MLIGNIILHLPCVICYVPIFGSRDIFIRFCDHVIFLNGLCKKKKKVKCQIIDSILITFNVSHSYLH